MHSTPCVLQKFPVRFFRDSFCDFKGFLLRFSGNFKNSSRIVSGIHAGLLSEIILIVPFEMSSKFFLEEYLDNGILEGNIG